MHVDIEKYFYEDDAFIENYLASCNIKYLRYEFHQIFVVGVFYATKYINETRTKNLVGHFTKDETASYVYVAFKYAIEHFR